MIGHRLGCLTFRSTGAAELFATGPGEFRHVVTVNAEIFVLAHENARYGRVLAETLNVVDGRILQMLIRLRERGAPVAKLSGSDLIYDLAAYCRDRQQRLFLLGARPDVNRRACEVLVSRYPGLQLTGYAPPMAGDTVPAEWNRETVDRVLAARPAYLGVCLGSPKTEYWIADNAPALATGGVRFAIGLGGSADFVAGAKPRAPRAIQRIGLEWLFRVITDPRERFGRTLTMFRMPWYALRPPRGSA